ncbi:copper amine oxidase N-terminal domain-containing protein, partial [bacterium]
RKVVAMTRSKTISLIVNENFAYTPKPVLLDYPPRIVRGRVYVPLRFVVQSLGARVRYDAKKKIASITFPLNGMRMR